MKVRKNYGVFINHLARFVAYGTPKLKKKVRKESYGRAYDVDFEELKRILKRFRKVGYTIVRIDSQNLTFFN